MKSAAFAALFCCCITKTQRSVAWFNGGYADDRNANKNRCKMHTCLRLPLRGSWRQRRLKESACSLI